MTRLVIGLVVGLVLGSAVSAFAVGGWFSGEKFSSQSVDFKNGYVAGASDALEAIVDAQSSMTYLKSKLDCLNVPAKTDRLGDFRAWAERRMANQGDTQAASVIIGDACEP